MLLIMKSIYIFGFILLERMSFYEFWFKFIGVFFSRFSFGGDTSWELRNVSDFRKLQVLGYVTWS